MGAPACQDFEVDPMLCSCGAEMKIVSVITDAHVIARILRHLELALQGPRSLRTPRAAPARRTFP